MNVKNRRIYNYSETTLVTTDPTAAFSNLRCPGARSAFFRHVSHRLVSGYAHRLVVVLDYIFDV